MDLVTFIEEILNGKLHFLCSATHSTLSYTLHLLPLLLYSTNTIQKPHAALETSSPTVTVFILGLTFSRTLHFFISLCPLYRSLRLQISFKNVIMLANTRQVVPHLFVYLSPHPFCEQFLPVRFCLSSSWYISFGTKFFNEYSFIWICSIKRHYLQSQYLVKFHIFVKGLIA